MVEAGSNGSGKWCSPGKAKTYEDFKYFKQRKSTNVSRANVVLADTAAADATTGDVHYMDHKKQYSRAGAHNFAKRF